ncbi:O-antigen ligase family protein [Polynucleobacter sp. MWH-CaK5]|uniref:O-antigen ligase family protein n=1 Tax=Polynucleobacter sp. MWH-CaK5 TaxID=2689107 RepID=UPI001BFDC68F|nr:O-antigen ligase family protein [Polynucleobacter sp. MWH-CaK5]QWD89173.1 O-antigen ligase family protein [Polynucleobacter sp. MWH-CaK5]
MNTLAIHSLEDIQVKITQWIAAGLTIALFFSAPVVNILEGLLILSVISSKTLRNRLIKALNSPICITALLFYAIIIIAAIYSIAPSNEAWGMVNGWRKILILPFAYVALFKTASKDLIIQTFLITSIACLAWSFLSYNFPGTFFYTTSAGIIVKNHATQGMFFGIAMLICLTKASKSPIFDIQSIALYFTSLIFFINILTVTHGRSGYVITFICLISFLIYQTRNLSVKKRTLVLIASIVMSSGLFVTAEKSRNRILEGIQEMTQPRSSGDAGSIGVRTYWWKHSIEMIQKNPVLGIGTGAFAVGLDNEIKDLTGPAATKTNDPHNQFLKILVEQGVIGFLALLAIIFSAFITKNVSQPYRMIGLTVLIGWCATSLANSHFSTFHEGHFIWFWLGAMLASEK